MHVDGQVRRPDDNVGVVATGAVNSDGVDDIRRDDGGAGVGATDPCDSNSMMDVGRSDEYAGVGVLGFDNSYNRVESYQDGDVTGTLGEPCRCGGSASTGPGISTIVGRAPGADDPGIIGQPSGVGDPGNGDVGDPLKKGHSLQFSAHVYCDQTAGCIRLPLRYRGRSRRMRHCVT